MEGRRGEARWAVWLVNGFWQAHGGGFCLLAGADSGYPLEDAQTPTLPVGTIHKGQRASRVSYVGRTVDFQRRKRKKRIAGLENGSEQLRAGNPVLPQREISGTYEESWARVHRCICASRQQGRRGSRPGSKVTLRLHKEAHVKNIKVSRRSRGHGMKAAALT